MTEPAAKLPAVNPATRELNFSSVSSIGLFDPNQEGGCQRRWYAKTILGFKEPEKESQKIGTGCHTRIEHYSNTGQDLLGPIERPGKHLITPPGPGTLIEWGFNDKPKPTPETHFFPPHESLLRADGLPLIGFIDHVNTRGVYVDEDGKLQQDPEGTVEVVDNKTSGNFAWAKTAEQLIKTTQMPGYGAWCREKFPWVRHVRLSHIYFNTKKRAAMKVTKLFTLEQIAESWQKVGVLVVREMRGVARLARFEDVPKNTAACGAFGGCPHLDRCFKTPLERLKALKGNTMGLLAKARAAGGATPPPPPSNGATAAAQVPPSANTATAVPTATTVPAPPPTTIVAQAPAAATTTVSAPPAAPAFGSIEVSKCENGTMYVVDAQGTLAEFTGTSRKDGAVIGFFQTEKGPLKLPGTAKVDPKPAPPPEPPKAEARPDTSAKAPKKRKAAAEKPAVDGIVLFINCAPNQPYESLDIYSAQVADVLAEEHDLADIRFPPDSNHPLAFNRWKGALAAAVRKSPPPPGYYVTHGYGELANEVVAALMPLCALVVR